MVEVLGIYGKRLCLRHFHKILRKRISSEKLWIFDTKRNYLTFLTSLIILMKLRLFTMTVLADSKHVSTSSEVTEKTYRNGSTFISNAAHGFVISNFCKTSG